MLNFQERQDAGAGTVKPKIIHTLWQMQEILLVSNHGTVLLLLNLVKKDTTMIYNYYIKLIWLQIKSFTENNSFLKKCFVQNYSCPKIYSQF